jgi:hypothetical protein
VELSLKASKIIVAGGLFVGDVNSPYPNNASIKLYGDRNVTRKNATYGTVELGSKVLAVFGTLRLCGALHARTWTRLQQPAQPGDTVIFVQGLLSWQPGSEIVITTSTYSSGDTEYRTLVSNTWLTEGVTRLVLDRPLLNTHVCEAVSRFSKWYRVEAEVGMLTRNVVVESGEESDETVVIPDLMPNFNTTEQHRFGARIVVVAGVVPDLSGDFVGNVTIQYVRINQFGQADLPRGDGIQVGTPGLLRPPRGFPPVIVEGCVMSRGFQAAVGLYESIKDVHVLKNIVLDGENVGVRVRVYQQPRRHVVNGNLVVTLRFTPQQIVNSSGVWNVALGDDVFGVPAGFQMETSALAAMVGNTVAGCSGVGFALEPEPCNATLAVVTGSVAHSCEVGLVVTRSARARVNCSYVSVH